MKIIALHFEVIRATPAVAEFLVRAELDAPAEGPEVTGRAAGPRRPGVSTVEVDYPMTLASANDSTVSLRCVIPEPNLWTAETPFTYGVTVECRLNGMVADSCGGVVALRAVKDR
jgi:hypothetical protein